MKKMPIEEFILLHTDTKDPIPIESLWKNYGGRKNDFYQVAKKMINEEWIRRVKGGIIRREFSKKDFLKNDRNFVKKWSEDSRKTIFQEHKPLFKETKQKKFYLTKQTQVDLYGYFHQIDYHTLNILNRNFLAYRLKLITPQEYQIYNKEIEELFDYMLYEIINDHRSFKKQILEHYQKAIHQTEFMI
jgi:hypothetical protein